MNNNYPTKVLIFAIQYSNKSLFFHESKKRPVCVVTTYTGLQVKVKVKKLRELSIYIYRLGLALISFCGIAYR